MDRSFDEIAAGFGKKYDLIEWYRCVLNFQFVFALDISAFLIYPINTLLALSNNVFCGIISQRGTWLISYI